MSEKNVETRINVRPTRGGARPGAGRPTVDTKEVKLRLSPGDHELLKTLGSSRFVHDVLDGVRGNRVSFTLPLDKLTQEQEDAFYEGFVKAGGPEAVDDDTCPWGKPWFYEVDIEVTGATPAEWGASWWRKIRVEVAEQTTVGIGILS